MNNMSNYSTREQWLDAAVHRLGRLFKAANVELPEVRVSIGWPSKGGTSSRARIVGQCWKKSVAKDGINQIFISPTLGEDPLQALGVLLHELVHAADDCESGHKNFFARTARALGLEGKLTATTVGPESPLASKLNAVLEDLGPLPHAPLNVTEMDKQRKPQTNRMLKLHAPDCCGFVARAAKKWLDDEGFPSCPHGVTMELA